MSELGKILAIVGLTLAAIDLLSWLGCDWKCRTRGMGFQPMSRVADARTASIMGWKPMPRDGLLAFVVRHFQSHPGSYRRLIARPRPVYICSALLRPNAD